MRILFQCIVTFLQFLTAEDAMRDGRSPIIIDNTNIQAWEMKPYVRMVSVVFVPHYRREPRRKQPSSFENRLWREDTEWTSVNQTPPGSSTLVSLNGMIDPVLRK